MGEVATIQRNYAVIAGVDTLPRVRLGPAATLVGHFFHCAAYWLSFSRSPLPRPLEGPGYFTALHAIKLRHP
jgi:hypothetical protein